MKTLLRSIAAIAPLALVSRSMAIAALAFGLSLGGAQAAVVNIEYTGVVGTLFDFTNGGYTGMNYTADYVFDTSDSNASAHSSTTQNYVYGGTKDNNTSPALSASITIGTSTITIPVANGYFGEIAGQTNGTTYSEQYHEADDTGGIYLKNLIEEVSQNLVLPTSISSAFTYSVATGDIVQGSYCSGSGCYLLFPKTLTETLGETPLPATLPLFATGVGGLGLLSWRRKRKAAAAVASSIPD